MHQKTAIFPGRPGRIFQLATFVLGGLAVPAMLSAAALNGNELRNGRSHLSAR